MISLYHGSNVRIETVDLSNDTIGLQMREYRRKHQALRGFLEGIRYEKGETFQYAFCTERSLQYLQRI